MPNKDGSTYGLASLDGDTHLIYVHKENFQTHKGRSLFKPTTESKHQYQWFNTLTGEFTPLKTVEKDQQFSSPWRGQADAILIGRKIN